MKNSIKLETLYNAIYPVIEWHDDDPFDTDINKIERINNLRKKYRKIMETVVGEIPKKYKDSHAYYIDLCHIPVIAALLIRTASDKDLRFKSYRLWLNGKFSKYPQKYYNEILEFGEDIEQLLDDIYYEKLYVTDLYDVEIGPPRRLELSLYAKNFWELLLKESMHYNEAKMYNSMHLSLKQFEMYLPILPQVFDGGDFVKDYQRDIENKLIDGKDFTLFDDQDFETKTFNELLDLAKDQGKARNLFIQMIQRYAAHIKSVAEARILAMYNGPEEYLKLISKDLGYTPEQTDNLINDFYSTQYADAELVNEQQPAFLSPDTVLRYRIHRIEENDEALKVKIRQIKQSTSEALATNTTTAMVNNEPLSTFPDKNEKEFSDALEDESQASEESS